jgi:hypothetical protein
MIADEWCQEIGEARPPMIKPTLKRVDADAERQSGLWCSGLPSPHSPKRDHDQKRNMIRVILMASETVSAALTRSKDATQLDQHVGDLRTGAVPPGPPVRTRARPLLTRLARRHASRSRRECLEVVARP